MDKILWALMPKYNKLMHYIAACRENKQRLHLENGIILDFKENKIEYEKEVLNGHD